MKKQRKSIEPKPESRPRVLARVLAADLRSVYGEGLSGSTGLVATDEENTEITG